MRLKQSPKSKNIQPQEQTPNFPKKRNPEGNTGLKGDRLYNSPEYKSALNDISTQFRDKVNQRQGKGDRQDKRASKVDDPMADFIRKIQKRFPKGN